MKKAWGIYLLCVFVMVLVACAGTKREELNVERSQLVKVTATVEAIDLETRMVTLKGPEGNTVTFRAGEHVRNLPQVEVGDRVVVEYYEAMAVRMAKPGEAPSGEMGALVRAEPGEKPGAAGARELTITASIEAIDKKTPSVTLMGPRGNKMTFKVMEPKNLEKVKVGDRIVITYTEAMAVFVEVAE